MDKSKYVVFDNIAKIIYQNLLPKKKMLIAKICKVKYVYRIES